jgi:hypothetical protein
VGVSLQSNHFPPEADLLGNLECSHIIDKKDLEQAKLLLAGFLQVTTGATARGFGYFRNLSLRLSEPRIMARSLRAKIFQDLDRRGRSLSGGPGFGCPHSAKILSFDRS